MSGRSRVAVGAGSDWLRRFAIGILLLSFSAFVLQAAAHASPGGHFFHQELATATTSDCAQHHTSGHHGADPAAGGVSDDIGLSLMDCSQACLAAAVLVEPLTFAPSVEGDVSSRTHPDHCGRSPDGILRPPRLITAA